jgi:hypothetical protein
VSLIAGTPVQTRDGLKPIEQIQVGDWVLSRPEDPAQGTGSGYKRVTKTFRFEDKEVVRFCWHHQLGDGNGEFDSVFVTPDHPVWSYPHGWVVMGRMHMVGRRIPSTIPLSDDEWFGRDLVLADGSAGERYDVEYLYRTGLPHTAFCDEDGWGLGTLVDFSGPIPAFGEELPYDYERWGDPTKQTRSRYTTTVYNLEVEDWHTYFVGKTRLWVHNTHCAEAALRLAPGDVRQ